MRMIYSTKKFIVFAAVIVIVVIQSVMTNLDIYGGQPASPCEYPFQVAILSVSGSLVCGGALISSSYVLTAAHCVLNKEKLRSVIVGTPDLKNASAGVKIEINATYTNPNFYNDIHEGKEFPVNDIAILKLNDDIQSSDCISAVSLYDGDSFNSSVEFWISGWGITKYSVVPSASDRLMTMRAEIVDIEKCHYCNATTRFCAGSNTSSTCIGDSGDPFVFKDNNRTWNALGVLSYATYPNNNTKSCNTGIYTCYTNISSYIDWIQNVTDGLVAPDNGGVSLNFESSFFILASVNFLWFLYLL
jgi:secreted trypsin-like serine protease